mgnify:CR=1 FL=1
MRLVGEIDLTNGTTKKEKGDGMGQKDGKAPAYQEESRYAKLPPFWRTNNHIQGHVGCGPLAHQTRR